MNKSIKMAVLLPTLLVLILGIAVEIFCIGIISSDTGKKLSNELVREALRHYVFQFKSTGEASYGTIETASAMVKSLRRNNAARETVVEALAEVLSTNDKIFGIWTLWEPNAFDSNDKSYAGKAYHDETGRFIPYIYRIESGYTVEANIEYTDPIRGAYYLEPLQYGRMFVAGPYEWAIGGRDILMYSFVIPIKDENDLPLGVVGIDFELGTSTDLLANIKFMDDGYIFTLSPDGFIANHPNRDLILKEYRDFWVDKFEADINNLYQNGGTFSGTSYSDLLKTPVIFSAQSVAFGESEQRFIVCAVVPKKTVNAPVVKLVIVMIIIAVVLVILIGATIVIIINTNLKPIETLKFAANEIANGNLDIDINIQSENELGGLSKSLKKMAKSLKKYIQNMESIKYASRIQKSLLPLESQFQTAFSDYSVKWHPKDIVGGDIYWLKTFTSGSVLCVCDCTGHGTPGAFLTMLVVSELEAAVSEQNCNDTAHIIWELEQRLVNVFKRNVGEENTVNKDGCDLAVLFIDNDGSVTFSSGHTHIFVCDGNEVTQYKGQKIFVGEGELESKHDIKVSKIPPNPENKFYIASDGLFDQPGGEHSRPYGYRGFKKIILENHYEKQTVISDKIWNAFEQWRGKEPRVDDFELITFKP